MVAELQAARGEFADAQRLIANLAKMLRGYQEELGRPLAPPPEVRHAMTVHSGGMRAITMQAGKRTLVVVAPADGFNDPDESWRNIVGHYGKSS